MTRDGIQFIHDQTLRHMNKGATPDELVNLVKMPPYLSDYTPFLREYYGTVKHSVRQIYNGYLGWFAGDPVDLDPLPAPKASKRYIALMGGRNNVISHAEKALKEQEYQWAAELVTHLISIDRVDQDARNIKARAYRELGVASMNINWRNWYLSASYELEGKIDPLKNLISAVGIFSSPDVISQWPLAKILEGLSVRLNPEVSKDINLKINFTAVDTNEQHGLEVRQSIMQFHDVILPEARLAIQAPRQAIIGLLMGKLSVAQFTALPVVSITGNADDLNLFISMLDPFLSPIKLAVH
jgi:alkyl sulfatase BDS1-like metallo-beta-lactamase superfamily hydrolase